MELASIIPAQCYTRSMKAKTVLRLKREEPNSLFSDGIGMILPSPQDILDVECLPPCRRKTLLRQSIKNKEIRVSCWNKGPAAATKAWRGTKRNIKPSKPNAALQEQSLVPSSNVNVSFSRPICTVESMVRNKWFVVVFWTSRCQTLGIFNLDLFY